MYKLYVTALFVFVFFMSFLGLQQVNAAGQGIVISRVQLENSASANNELVQIYNNSPDDIDITNWYLQYVRTSGTTVNLAYFNGKTKDSRVFIPGHSAVLATSTEYANETVPVVGDISFSGVLSGDGGYVRLLDNDKSEIDKVGWGVSPVEAKLVTPAPDGFVLKRKSIDANTLIDTDISNSDFEVVPSEPVFYGQIYEMPDLCQNLDGFQGNLPNNYVLDDLNCQLSVADICSSMNGVLSENGECASKVLPLQISEILPNAVGVDSDNEFIELYNPNSADVNLDDYVFYIGPSYSKAYSFPIGQVVKSGQYKSIYNKDISFTLPNTSGSVKLQSDDGYITDETAVYNSPKEGSSWALIDNDWKYTNQTTPDAANLPMLVDDDSELFVVSSLQACAANQYRSPETNRCRLIVSSSAATLTACRDGQYRSEETNRCRNIVSDVSSLMSCAEGQERNPATNRCRSTASLASTELAPCKAGQERNPETNRCRNVASMPTADYAPEQVKVGSSNNYVWFALAGVGTLAAGYGLWEWRVEIGKLFKKLAHFKK